MIINKTRQNKFGTIITKFSFLQFFFWSTWAIFGSYLVYYLTDIGYNNMQIGTLMSIRTFMEVISPPVLGYLTDKIEDRKTVFIISMILLGVMIIPFQCYGNIMLIIIISLFGFLWSPQQSILDSWILETSSYTAENYGFMRAWGSIGFAITVTIFGQVIDKLGWTVHFLSYGVVVFLVVIFAYLIQDNSFNKKNTIGYRTNSDIKKEDSKKIGNRNIILLFKNRDYIFVLFISFLIFIPNIMIFTYLAPIIKSVGGNSTNLGYTLFFNALSEAPVFFISKYFLIKYKTKFLLLFSASFYLIRIIIAAVAVSPVYFIFYGLLQSLSFGVYLVTVRYYIKMVAPEGLKTTAQSFAQMASFGGGGIVASLLGGYLIDNYGMNAMFITCIFFISLAVVILLVSIMRNKT